VKSALFALLIAVSVFPARSIAHDSERVVGTWKLVSASSSSAGGEKDATPFGPSPVGFLTYTADGTMNVIISHGGRNLLSVADRIVAPPEERAEAFATCFAYAGRYTVNGDKVIHHVEAASIQNWVGTDLVRVVHFHGDEMILQTPTMSVGGKMITTELVWARVKP
jgi:hypothetical protein